MNMITINFQIPEYILYALNENNQEFTSQIRLMGALQLFKEHKLSLEKAADLANMDKELFKIELDKHEIPLIDYDPEELDEELEAFKR